MSGRAAKSCASCGAKFANRQAADPVFPRRCRTEAEMLTGGMWQSQRGVWQAEAAGIETYRWQWAPPRRKGAE